MIPPSSFTCSVCKEPKTGDHFFWKKDGTIQSQCKECRRAASRAKNLAKRVAAERTCDQCGGPIPVAAGGTAKRCSRACQLAYQRNYVRDRYVPIQRDPIPCGYCGENFMPHRSTSKHCSDSCSDKARYGPKRKEQSFTRKWGLTYEQRDELLTKQDGCAICHTWDPNSKGWQIDHDHRCCPEERSCGKCIRGVLCAHCNCGIGLLGDEPDRLEYAAAYLRACNSQWTLDASATGLCHQLIGAFGVA